MAPLTKKQRSQAAKKAAATRKRKLAEAEGSETTAPEERQAGRQKAIRDEPINQTSKAQDVEIEAAEKVRAAQEKVRVEKGKAVEEFNNRAATPAARPLSVTSARPRLQDPETFGVSSGHGARRDFGKKEQLA